MRVAQRMISRNYKTTLNTSLSRRTETLERSTSGLKFQKLSDNVSDGARAMQIQEERYQSTQQLSNVENLISEMEAVDSSMESIHSILQTVSEKVLTAMSEDWGPTAREVLAQEIGSLKDQIVQFANTQFGGKYLFAGTNNSSAPITVDETTGRLMFNGVDVESVYEEDGKFYYDVPDPNDPTVTVKTQVPNSDETYADIGLGLKISDEAQVDPRTAFQVSFSALDLLGFGASKTGSRGTEVSSNVYNLMTQLQNAITPTISQNQTRDLHDQLLRLTDDVGMIRTDLGDRGQFLERTKNRLEDDIENMTKLETQLISSDAAEEAINMKEAEYVWMAVLQLGSQILPASLLDFMR